MDHIDAATNEPMNRATISVRAILVSPSLDSLRLRDAYLRVSVLATQAQSC